MKCGMNLVKLSGYFNVKYQIEMMSVSDYDCVLFYYFYEYPECLEANIIQCYISVIMATTSYSYVCFLHVKDSECLLQ